MKTALPFLFFHFFLVSPLSDSCSSSLNLKVPNPFDTSNLRCLPVWKSQSFILRYKQTSANTWSFILSTPDTNSYIAMGFSAAAGGGQMVGSSAVVGWVASRGGSGGIKKYYLGGKTQNQVVPDGGNLQIIGNSSFITLQSSRLYMVFELETTEPASWLIYATGPTGIFPSAPSYELAKHLDKSSTRIDYTAANVGSSQSNGSSQADSCGSKLTLSVGLSFDTTNLNCLSVWDAEGYILRYSQASTNKWSFILSTPNTDSYIAMGFSPSGGMVGSSAIVGWVSSNGSVGGMKQYYLGGQTPGQVVPDKGNLQIVSNSTLIISQGSSLYMAFQLQTTQPLSQLIYSVGPTGFFPSAPGYSLIQHRDQVATTINYATGSSSSSNPFETLRRTHGLLNIAGWGILVIIGTIIVRHMKAWDPHWFYLHASLQTLAFFLGVSGVVTGLILNNRLQADVSIHKAIGIIILVLGSLQMMALLARPGKESKKRKYWNLYHQNTGRVLILLAIANIFYGLHLGNEGSGLKIGYGVVLGVSVFVAVILEIRLWRED